MVLLGDAAQLEAHFGHVESPFGPFGDVVYVRA
jgi:hypothetical protein